MSVTFSVQINPEAPMTFGVKCHEHGVVSTGASYEMAVEERSVHMEVCRQSRAYGLFVNPDTDYDADDLDVNLANGNARHILGVLFPDTDHTELIGTSSAAGLREQACAHLARTYLNGYATEVLTRLVALADEAHRLGRGVTWA